MNEARLFVVLVSGYLVCQLLVSWQWQLAYFRGSRPIERPPFLLSLWALPSLTERQFKAAGVAIVGGCAIGIAGWRGGFALAAAACLAYFGQIRLLDTIQRKVNLIPQVLLLFAAEPGSVASWGAPADSWLLGTTKMLIVLVYVSAGVTKLRRAGLRWADGRAVQAYLLGADLRYDVPRARSLAAHLSLCAALSAFVLAFELVGWLWLLVPRGDYVFACLGLGLHAATFAFMRVNYLKYFGPMYLVFAAHPLAAVIGHLAAQP